MNDLVVVVVSLFRGGPNKEMTVSILSTWEYYMYPMEPPIIQEVSVSPAQLHIMKEKRRPDIPKKQLKKEQTASQH